MMALHPDTCALRLAYVRSKRVVHVHGSDALVSTQDPSVAMSVQQAIHELQEQLERVSGGHQAMHQELSTLRRMVDTTLRTQSCGAEDLDARPGSERRTDRVGERGRIWQGTSSALFSQR